MFLATKKRRIYAACGVSQTPKKKEWKKGESIVQELDKSRPCIVHTIGHSTYGNHAALALGYEKIVSKKMEKI